MDDPLTSLVLVGTPPAGRPSCRFLPQTNEDVKVKAEELLQEFAMTVLLDDTVSEGLDPLIGSGKTVRRALADASPALAQALCLQIR